MASRKRARKVSRKRSNPFVTLVKLGLLAGVMMVVFLFRPDHQHARGDTGDGGRGPQAGPGRHGAGQRPSAAIGLGMTVEGEVYDASIPHGAVVSQLPTPGERIKANGRVGVVVSLGVQHNPVPDLIGSTQRVARLMSQQSGYEIGHTSEIFLADMGSDQIIRQVPNPGSTEVLTARVDVLVGRSGSELHHA